MGLQSESDQAPASLETTSSTPGSVLFGPAGMGLAFLWGLAEGTLFFIVPDVIITFVALFRPRRSLLHLGFAVIGALIAGAMMFVWARQDPETARAAVQAVPFVRPAMLKAADRQLKERGEWALLQAGFTGMPYKLYTVAAPAHLSLATLLLTIFIARTLRFLFTWALFTAFATILRTRGVRKALPMVTMHLCIWTAFYAFYWSIV